MRIANLISGLFCLALALWNEQKGRNKLATLDAVLASINISIWLSRWTT